VAAMRVFHQWSIPETLYSQQGLKYDYSYTQLFASCLNLNDVNSKYCVLSKFRANMLHLNQVLICSIRDFKWSLKAVGPGSVIITLVSSVYKPIVLFFLSIADGKSLIYIRNNSGPNTEPCGTPTWIFFHAEKWSLHVIFWYLSVI
jgi:hypothetical protein